MRLWSLHPCYLDPRGLVALWREALLAQKVLAGSTKGYKNHPQLLRFKKHDNTQAAISCYLTAVWEEACARGYNFDFSKIATHKKAPALISVTKGQLDFEREHLSHKLKVRAPDWGLKLPGNALACHPSFTLTNGPVAAWERP